MKTHNNERKNFQDIQILLLAPTFTKSELLETPARKENSSRKKSKKIIKIL